MVEVLLTWSLFGFWWIFFVWFMLSHFVGFVVGVFWGIFCLFGWLVCWRNDSSIKSVLQNRWMLLSPLDLF